MYLEVIVVRVVVVHVQVVFEEFKSIGKANIYLWSNRIRTTIECGYEKHSKTFLLAVSHPEQT